MGRLALWTLLTAFVCTLLVACAAPPDATVIDVWTLQVDGRTTPVRLPTHLDDGRVPDRDVRYRLDADVELPATLRGRDLVCVLEGFAGRAELLADGAAAPRVGADVVDGYHAAIPYVWRLPHDVGHLTLLVDHRWSQSAWFDLAPRLVPAGDAVSVVPAAAWLAPLVSTASVVALGQIGLTCVAVFLVDRRRRAYLWFGIQALSATVYPLFVGGLSQGVLGARAEVPILASTLVSAAIVSVYFTHTFFALRPPTRAWLAVLVVSALAVPLVAHGPYVATKVAGRTTVAVVSAVVVYQIVACARLVVRHSDRWSASLLLASWVGLGLSAWTDLLHWLGLGDLTAGVRYGPVGLTAFAFFLSLLLSRSHITTLNNGDELNAELARRVEQLDLRRREIEQLNEELRRQISDRASQIVAALALRERAERDAADLHAGDVVHGRYRVERPIGKGGMGSVYQVVRVSDGRRFALKLTNEVHGTALARLAREAQIASTVAHPNVVRIVDVDVAPSGFLYLVMELVEGRSLHDERPRASDKAWALSVLAQMARGLEALHAAGVVHRDLTPSNVLVQDGPRVKITDFGISRFAEPAASGPSPGAGAATTRDPTVRLVERSPSAADESGAQRPVLTRTGWVAGTPLYMAPELVIGAEGVTPAADMFALGVIAFELLAGRRPYAESAALAVLDGRAVAAPPPLASLWPEAPTEVAALLDACLALDSTGRPTAATVASALEAVAEQPAHRTGA